MACNGVFLVLQGGLQFFNFVTITIDIVQSPVFPPVDSIDLNGQTLTGADGWFRFQNLFGRFLNSGVITYFAAFVGMIAAALTADEQHVKGTEIIFRL